MLLNSDEGPKSNPIFQTQPALDDLVLRLRFVRKSRTCKKSLPDLALRICYCAKVSEYLFIHQKLSRRIELSRDFGNCLNT